jgi:ABC-type branched-subunit amino acid transport system ATPase component
MLDLGTKRRQPVAEPALKLAGLDAGYGASIVLRDVNLEVRPGEIVALLGKNGMGKSTLLKATMGYLPKSAGTVGIKGSDVTLSSPHRIARLGVAYIPQEKALFQDLTIEDNLRLALPMRHDWSAAQARVRRAFPFLLDRLRQRAGTLSGGEQKMLLMSRALASGANLVLVDEITEGLQPSIIEKLGRGIREERDRSGTSFLLIEQNIAFSLAVADSWAVLELGTIIDAGASSAPDASRQVTDRLSV